MLDGEMSFDNYYPNRKDWRKELRGWKQFSRSCRNHGCCSYCNKGRRYKRILAEKIANEKIKDYMNDD